MRDKYLKNLQQQNPNLPLHSKPTFFNSFSFVTFKNRGEGEGFPVIHLWIFCMYLVKKKILVPQVHKFRLIVKRLPSICSINLRY